MQYSSRELAYCGTFGAAALLFPLLFHLVRLGPLFMPMYIPLVALPFFVRPLPAGVTGGLVPILSGAVTGMPPFFPPIAFVMALEIAAMAMLISWAARRWQKAPEWLILLVALVMGRVLNVALTYAASRVMELPARFLAGLSFFSGWPGIILIMVTVPLFAHRYRHRIRSSIDQSVS